MNATARAANDDSDELGISPCMSLIPELPAAWYAWPLRISVGFILTPNTCVYRALFKEYQANSLARVMEILLAKANREIFVGYRFAARDFVPAFEFFAAWPLLRKGQDEPKDYYVGSDLLLRVLERGVRRRGAMRGAAPWEMVSDDTVFEIWREPVNVYGSRTVLMLRTGGRTAAEASDSWRTCARALRKCLARRHVAVAPQPTFG